MMGNIVTKTNA